MEDVLLLRKLGTKEQASYTDMLLPKNPLDLKFYETVKQLSQIFQEKSSLFNIRYQGLKLVNNDTDDFLMLISMANCECEKIKRRKMTEDQFKCPMFVSALKLPRDAEIRTHCSAIFNRTPNPT
ncbi:unnamed protein product [Schistocephalus solidus]|uniref:Reverse transcriptase domain-containing protein n=1 Tax=Schistocephalus solidus TaxID=70667 RepID=A0A183SKX8_SCHSO|nr:unnamed protein product [Schistocephalus solidus]